MERKPKTQKEILGDLCEYSVTGTSEDNMWVRQAAEQDAQVNESSRL